MPDSTTVAAERKRRESMWKRLLDAGGPAGVSAELLRKLRIYRGQSGIYIDKEQTKAIASDGATVAFLHTGSSYAEDLAEDSVIYHYPQTRRRGRHDASEIAATKVAAMMRLPVFVVTYPTPDSSKRDVHLGWIEGMTTRPADSWYRLENSRLHSCCTIRTMMRCRFQHLSMDRADGAPVPG